MKKIILTICILILFSGCNQQAQDNQDNNEEIQQLSNRIQQLESSMSDLKQKNDQLTQENNNLKKEVDNTKTKTDIEPEKLESKNVELTDCKLIVGFKNKNWFLSLENEFKKMKMPPTVGYDEYVELSSLHYMGDVGCFFAEDDVFVFANVAGIHVYDIDKNILKRNTYPHIMFEMGFTQLKPKENFIEIKSGIGGGPSGRVYYAKYYFLDNKVELYKKCLIKITENSEEETCDNVKQIFE